MTSNIENSCLPKIFIPTFNSQDINDKYIRFEVNTYIKNILLIFVILSLTISIILIITFSSKTLITLSILLTSILIFIWYKFESYYIIDVTNLTINYCHNILGYIITKVIANKSTIYAFATTSIYIRKYLYPKSFSKYILIIITNNKKFIPITPWCFENELTKLNHQCETLAAIFNCYAGTCQPNHFLKFDNNNSLYYEKINSSFNESTYYFKQHTNMISHYFIYIILVSFIITLISILYIKFKF